MLYVKAKISNEINYCTAKEELEQVSIGKNASVLEYN